MRKPSCFLPAIKILLCFSSLPEPATPRFSASPFPCPTFLLLSHAGNQRRLTSPHATAAAGAPPPLSSPSIRSSHRQPWDRASFPCLWPLSARRLCPPPTAVTATVGRPLAGADVHWRPRNPATTSSL
uniref:Uncharacterized protein n=1 Tax=Opuntia streptacantha TaxID=393608 RepID=A0A7C8Z2I6_OPUST